MPLPRPDRCPPTRRPPARRFRQQSDALERAGELDAEYGRNPDLAAMPMYSVVTAMKDPGLKGLQVPGLMPQDR